MSPYGKLPTQQVFLQAEMCFSHEENRAKTKASFHRACQQSDSRQTINRPWSLANRASKIQGSASKWFFWPLLLLPLLLLFALIPFFTQPKHVFVEMLTMRAKWLLKGKY